MKNDLSNFEATVGLAIWAAGGFVIYLLWGTRVFVHEFMETLFGAALYVVAFFYFLALPLCFQIAKNLIRGRRDKGE